MREGGAEQKMRINANDLPSLIRPSAPKAVASTSAPGSGGGNEMTTIAVAPMTVVPPKSSWMRTGGRGALSQAEMTASANWATLGEDGKIGDASSFKCIDLRKFSFAAEQGGSSPK